MQKRDCVVHNPLLGASRLLLAVTDLQKQCCLQGKTYQNFHQGLLLPCDFFPEPWLITFPIRQPFSGFRDLGQKSRRAPLWLHRRFAQV